MAKKNHANDQVVVVDATEGTGAVVFWSFHGATPYVPLVMAWEDQNLPERALMTPSSPAAALRAADMETRKHLPRGYFVRSVDKLTFVIVREVIGDDDDSATFSEEYEPAAKVSVTLRDDGPPTLNIRWPKGTNKQDNPLRDYADRIISRYRTAVDEVSLHSMDIWIRKMMESLVHVVALGERGKPFYVPPSRMETWTRVKAAILEANPKHTFRQIPAMNSRDCIEAVLDACTREVDSVCNAIYDELDADSIGERALKTRVAVLDELVAKMASFESILGPLVSTLNDSIEECKSAVVLATASSMDELEIK